MFKKFTLRYVGTIFSILILSSNILGSTTFSKPTDLPDLSNKDKHSNYQYANWTIMYYMAANNKYSKNTYYYLENLTLIGSNERVNIVVFRDGSGENNTGVYYVEKNNLIDIGVNYGWPSEVDSSSPQVLSKFCNEIIGDYPSNHYALFIMSPGFGWQGICPDFENTNYINFNQYMLDMPELKWALQKITCNGTRKIDILSFNMCITGMIEVAYEIHPYVNFMIASEADNAPMLSWPNVTIIQQLLNNPELNIEKIVKKIVEVFTPIYYQMHSPLGKILNHLPFPLLHTVSIKTSLAGINLSRVQQIIQSLEELGMLLKHNNQEYRSYIRESRQLVRTFGEWDPRYHILAPYYDQWLALNIFAYDDYIDLYDFARLINTTIDNSYLKTKCITLMNNIENAVIKINKLEGDHSYGLSIYFPRNKRFFNKPIYGLRLRSPYEKISLSRDTIWDEFLKIYLTINF